MSADETVRVQLGAESVQLVLPGSIAERWDVALVAADPGLRHRAMLAALALCWPRWRRHHPYHGNAAQYGAQLIEELAAKVPMDQLLGAGGEALRLCTLALPQVEGAEAFSLAPADGRSAAGG